MAVDLGKAKKILSQAYLDNNEDINEDSAANLVVKATQQVRELKREMKDDEKLVTATEIVKDLKGGYNSAIQYEEAKISYLLDKIEAIQEGDVNPDSSI